MVVINPFRVCIFLYYTIFSLTKIMVTINHGCYACMFFVIDYRHLQMLPRIRDASMMHNFNQFLFCKDGWRFCCVQT